MNSVIQTHTVPWRRLAIASLAVATMMALGIPSADAEPGGPTVTVEQATGQSDPANATPIAFTVTFSETVTGFDATDVTITGTATGGAATVTGTGAVYTVEIGGITADGTVIVSIPDGAATSTVDSQTSQPSTSTDNTVTYDSTAPTVTVEQATGQSDPANATPIAFTVTFSETVTGFDATDVTITGTATGGAATVTGTGAVYTVEIGGITADGTVIVSLDGSVATDAAGNANQASTSTDNTVTYDSTAPTVTINQAAGQSDPTNTNSVAFDVDFSETVTGFEAADVTLGGTATGGTTTVTAIDGANYTVTIDGLTSEGTVTASVGAGAAADAAGNTSQASTSTDNTVTYDIPAPPSPTPAFDDLDGLSVGAVTAIETLVDLGITTGTDDNSFSPAMITERWQMALFLTRVLETTGTTLPAGESGFSDLAGYSAEAQTAMNQLAILEISTGTSPGEFSPAGAVTRWQMALFLVRTLEAGGVTLPAAGQSTFTDLAGHPDEVQAAVDVLVSLGITTGTTESTFSPEVELPRWQMALFLARVIEVIQAG